VFNPTLQAAKFDPQGRFVHSILPELRNVPDKFIHEPWQMPLAVQQAAGCVVGQDYPAPIIDHAFARERVLAAYRRA
jgi:deoxyribodipyrimidine photo-lyase